MTRRNNLPLPRRTEPGGGIARRSLFGLAAAALASSPMALRAQSRPAEQPVSGGRLVWGVETEPATLNPQLNGQDKTKLLLRNVYESLLARTAEGGYVPWLATGYEVSADGRSYTFALRRDVVFSDGRKLDAAAVALNFSRLKDPAYAGSISVGPVSRLADAVVVDDHTVRLVLSRVYAPFLDFAASLELLSPAAYDSAQLKSGGKEIAGTGPFTLEHYARGQEIRYRRNPAYNWAPANAGHQGPAFLEEVTYRFLPESSVRVGALTSGQVDVIEGVSGNDAGLFQDDPGYTYGTALNTGTPYALFWNSEYGATTDVRVRRALNAAIDVDAVLRSVYRGQRTRAWGIVSPIDPQFYDRSIVNSVRPDKALANRLLDEAGWNARDGAGFRTRDGARLSVEVVQAQATVRDQRDVLLQAIQAQARQNAGIDLVISYVDAGTYADRRKTGRFGAIANSNTPTGGIDIENRYLPVEGGGALNYSRAHAPELVPLVEAAAATLDDRERFRIYAKLQRFALLDQAYSLPLYEPEDQVAVAAHVRGIGFRPFKQMPEGAYDVWIDRKRA